MKKFLVIIITFLLIITGCKNNKEDNLENDTVAIKLVNAFKTEIKNEKNLKKLANVISKNDIIRINVDVTEVKEGYLDGFDNEIKGFKKAYAIKPMIASQPFIAYIFETKNVEELKSTLKENANKRWNICTEADDLEITSVKNYVFLIMSPSSFDE